LICVGSHISEVVYIYKKGQAVRLHV